MGAESIQTLLKELDLKSSIKDIQDEMPLTKSEEVEILEYWQFKLKLWSTTI